MLETKIISAMEKCFLDQTPADFPVLERIRMYKNERATVQFAVYDPDEPRSAPVSWIRRFYVPNRGCIPMCLPIR